MDSHKLDSRKKHLGPLPALLLFLAVLLGASPGQVVGAAKAASTSPIAVEVGKAKLIRLPGAPDVIVLGNPAVADVVVEANGRLFLLGREPGETNLVILNKAGKTILSAAIVVGPVKRRRVTVDRGSETFTLSCDPRCVPVANPEGTGATTAAAAPAAPGNEASAAGGGLDTGDIASALSGLLGN